MKTNIVIEILSPIPYLAKLWFSSYGPKCCWAVKNNNKFAICLQKEVSDEVDFLHANKHESLLQIDAMILKGTAKHSQNYQNSKVQCLYNTSKDEVDFFHVG